jgi:hypothetical protein
MVIWQTIGEFAVDNRAQDEKQYTTEEVDHSVPPFAKGSGVRSWLIIKLCTHFPYLLMEIEAKSLSYRYFSGISRCGSGFPAAI